MFVILLIRATIDAIAEFVEAQRAKHVKEMASVLDLLLRRVLIEKATAELTGQDHAAKVESKKADADPA